MSKRLDELAARKSLLVAQLRLQRMEFAVHADDVRIALRPAGLIGSAVAQLSFGGTATLPVSARVKLPQAPLNPPTSTW